EPGRRLVRSPAVRKIRDRILRRFSVWKHVGLVGPLVDRRATELREPDRLRTRLPRRRLGRFHPTDPVEMLVLPPRDQVLVAEDPRLAVGAIGDLRSLPRLAGLRACIVPVKALA